MTTLRKVLLGLAILAVVLGLLGWRRLAYQADVGAGFVARTVCGCVLIAGRSLASCRADVPPSMDRVKAELAPGGSGVHAFIRLFASRTATYDPKTGCTLD